MNQQLHNETYNMNLNFKTYINLIYSKLQITTLQSILKFYKAVLFSQIKVSFGFT